MVAVTPPARCLTVEIETSADQRLIAEAVQYGDASRLRLELKLKLLFCFAQCLGVSEGGAMIRCLPVAILMLASSATHAAEMVVSEKFHHLRSAEPREWSHYPERAEAPRLTLGFDLGEAAPSFRLLTLRQAGVKQAWSVQLNGRKLGQLERDHNDLELALEIPAELLKPAGNQLEIATGSKAPDDIRVGEIVLRQETRQQLTASGELSVTVGDADGRGGLPCRLTIVDAESRTLVLLGAKSDERLAVRSGVVYTLDGRAKIGLRPGRYKIWAGRGFEYSLATTEIEIGDGDVVGTRLDRRRGAAK